MFDQTIDKTSLRQYNIRVIFLLRGIQMGISYIIGQILGIVAIIIGFVTFQMKTKRQILFMQTTTAVIFCVHYFLIGAMTGVVMNIVATIRNLVYDYCGTKGYKTKLVPITFVVIQAAVAILVWEAWYSVFVLLGICINTYCMSLSKPQNVRSSILVSSPLVFIYNAFTLSIGGMIYESVAVASSAIGLFRYMKNKKEKKA